MQKRTDMTGRRKKIIKITSSIFVFLLVLFVTVSYFSYRHIKRAFLSQVSQKATAFLGQRVEIIDLSFGPSGHVDLQDIVIRNPEGFPSGDLLRVKTLSLFPKWRELARARLSFRSIEVSSPDITLITDKQGLLNVSDKLKQFLSKKVTVSYRVDELRIRSGTVLLNNNTVTTSRGIDLSMKDLSSRVETKTAVNGSMSYAGNTVGVEGWVYLNSPGKKFSLALSSRDFSLSAFRDTLGKYGMDTENLQGALKIDAEGDAERGCSIFSSVTLKGRKTFLFYRDTKDIRLELDAFFHLPERDITVNDLFLFAEGGSSLHLRGSMRDIGGSAAYEADIRIDKMDLSRFNIMKGLEIGGEVTSDAARIKGKGGEMMPEISGSIRLRGGTVKSSGIHIKEADADVSFSTGKEISLNAAMTGKIFSLYDYHAAIPVDAAVTVNARGKPDTFTLISSLRLSPVQLKMKDGRMIRLDSSDSSVVGTLSRGAAFAGRGLIRMKEIAYADFTVHGFAARFGIDSRKDLIAFKDLKIESEEIGTSMDRIGMQTDRKKQTYSFEVRGMTVLYPGKECRLSNADLLLNMHTGGGAMSGNAILSSGEITFQGIHATVQSGSLEFDEKGFYLGVPVADVAGGKIMLEAKGKLGEGPFPLEVTTTAENIDLGALSRTAYFDELPYAISGSLVNASFAGSLGPSFFAQGKAFAEARNVIVLEKAGKRKLVKDGAVKAEITFTGKDWGFDSDIAAGSVHAAVSGKGKGFAEGERKVTARISLPETKVADIRNSFWDIFPDRLLYAGLDGALSSAMAVEYSSGKVRMTGDISLRNVLIQGEESEYSVGPIDGRVPLQYDTTKKVSDATELPSFERSEFLNLSRYYSREPAGEGYQRITIGSLRYGFRILDALDIRVKEEVNRLNIVRLDATIFGGKLNGSAIIDFSEGLAYRAGFLLEGLSLTKLCKEIEPVKGYLSGKVDGLAALKGSGMSMSGLLGKADFWTYSSGDEKTKVSGEFLQKIGGPSLRAYLGDRSFDKGVMGIYLQNGYVIFRELEISHRNMMGMTDLSVKVAPYNNRIEIDHLLWTITEAAQRAGERH